MPLRAPGPSDDDMAFLLAEVRKAQEKLDAAVAEARSLPDSNLTKSAKIARYNSLQREIENTFSRLSGNVDSWSQQILPRYYSEGFTLAGAELDAGFSFTLVHEEAVGIIVQDSQDDVGTGLQQIVSNFNDKINTQRSWEQLDTTKLATIRAKGKEAVTQQLLTGLSPRETAAALRDELWDNGVEIVDRSGRRWNMETYTRMLVRTKSAQAFNSGSLNKYSEEGVNRVRVFDGVLDDADCAEANGQVWTVRYAMRNMLSHPNCRRAFGPVPGEGRVNQATAAEVAKQVAGVAFDINRVFTLAKVLRRWSAQPGILNLHDDTFARIAIRFEAELFDTEYIDWAIDQLERQLESVIDPALERLGLLDEIPDIEPPDWALVRKKVGNRTQYVAVIEESRSTAREAELLLPAPNPDAFVNVVVRQGEDDETLEIIRKLAEATAVEEELSIPHNLHLEFHNSLRKFLDELGSIERTELVQILPDPTGIGTSGFLSGLIDALDGVTADDIIDEIVEFMDDMVDARLNNAAEFAGRLLDSHHQALNSNSIWERISQLDPVLWEDSGLKKLLGNGANTSINDIYLNAWAVPMERGIIWGFSGVGPEEISRVLRVTFGESNVAVIDERGINGTLYAIRKPSGGEVIVKHVSDGATGNASDAIVGQTVYEIFSEGLSYPHITHEYIPSSATGKFYDVMPGVPDAVSRRAKPIIKYGLSGFSEEDFRQLSLLDLLIGNTDSHGGQVLVRELADDPRGRVLYGIDQERVLGILADRDGVPADFEVAGGRQVRAGMFNMPTGIRGLEGGIHYSVPGGGFHSNVIDALIAADGAAPSFLIPGRPTVAPYFLTDDDITKILRGGIDLDDFQQTLDQLSYVTVFDSTGMIVFNVQGVRQPAFFPGQFVLTDELAGNAAGPVHYLTTSEVELVQDILDGSVSRELLDRVGRVLEDFDDNHFPRDPAQLAAFAGDWLEARTRYLVDNGFLALDNIELIDDFGTGYGLGTRIELGDIATLDLTDGSRIKGLVTNIYETSDGMRAVQVYDGIGVPGAPSRGLFTILETEVRRTGFDPDAPLPIPRYRSAEVSWNEPITLQRWKSGPTGRPVKDPIFDDLGMHIGFEESTISIDVAEVVDIPRPGGPIPRREVVIQAERILDEELRKIAPEYRPKSIRLSSDLILSKSGNSALGVFYKDGSRHLELSLAQPVRSAGAIDLEGLGDLQAINQLDWEAFRRTVRHELAHSVDFGLQVQRKVQLKRKILFDLIEEIQTPGGTQYLEDPTLFELNEIARQLLVRPSFRPDEVVDLASTPGFRPDRVTMFADTGQLTELLEQRAVLLFKEIQTAQVRAYGRWQQDVFERVLARDPDLDWANYPLRTTDINVAKQEFLAEAYANAEGAASRTPPPLLDERTYWGMFSDENFHAMINGDIDLPDPLEIWGGSAIRNIGGEDFLLLPAEEKYSAAKLVDRVFSDGGFTVKVVDGTSPPDGYTVARRENEVVIKGWSKLSRQEKAKLLADYRDDPKNAGYLDQDEWFFGVWYEGTNQQGEFVDTIYLDVSRNFRDEFEAVRFSIKEEQVGIWDVEAFDTIYMRTDPTPEFPRGESKYSGLTDYIIQNKPEALPDPEHRIAALKGARKVNGEEVSVIFTGPNGEHVAMGMEGLEHAPKDPEGLIERIIEAAENRYAIIPQELYADRATRLNRANHTPLPISIDSVKHNLRKVLGIAREEYLSDPTLRQKDKFYEFWNRAFLDVEAKTAIPMPRITAAASNMSPGLDADENFRRVIRFAFYVSEDRTVPSPDVSKVQKTLNKIRDEYLAEGKLDRAALFDFTVTSNTRQSELPAEAAFVVFRTLYKADTGVGFGVSKSSKFFEDSIRILRGELKDGTVPIDKIATRDEVLDAYRITRSGLAEDELDDLAEAVRKINQMGIGLRGDGFGVEFLNGTQMRKFAAPGTRVAPNGASTSRRVRIRTSWQDLPNTLSRERAETIIHELGHIYDPFNTNARSLRRAGWTEADIGITRELSDEEFWSEAFLAAATGRAPEGMIEAVVEAADFVESLGVPVLDEIVQAQDFADLYLGNSKVRSFYNNIMDPFDRLGLGDVTIDYHQANLSAQVIGFDRKERLDNDKFNDPRTGRPKVPGMGGGWETPGQFGVSLGLRPLFAQALRDLFNEIDSATLDELQIFSYAQLQEVLWATWRRGFPGGTPSPIGNTWGNLPRIIVAEGSGLS